ncbi:TetR/AcrR family transcriptional regulator [Amycolatopsis sp. cmx-4-61]|uniref:TetR/AcrR family transcriptional regulator n=1 Tax=unclassified Amycolatopsis TaxID=2618356 RepID=UPI00397A16D6
MGADERSANRRERQKLATRQQLSRAALRLAVERGPAHVRVEEIAAEADVALRTFHNHFASKEEAIMSVGVERAAAISAALGRRPAGESLVDALATVFSEQYGFDGDLDDRWLAGVRLAMSTPGLRGEYLKTLESSEQALAVAIAQRISVPADDLGPRVLAAAVSGAVRVAVAHWLNHGPANGLPSILHSAIRSVVADRS